MNLIDRIFRPSIHRALFSLTVYCFIAYLSGYDLVYGNASFIENSTLVNCILIYSLSKIIRTIFAVIFGEFNVMSDIIHLNRVITDDADNRHLKLELFLSFKSLFIESLILAVALLGSVYGGIVVSVAINIEGVSSDLLGLIIATTKFTAFRLIYGIFSLKEN